MVNATSPLLSKQTLKLGRNYRCIQYASPSTEFIDERVHSVYNLRLVGSDVGEF